MQFFGGGLLPWAVDLLAASCIGVSVSVSVSVSAVHTGTLLVGRGPGIHAKLRPSFIRGFTVSAVVIILIS